MSDARVLCPAVGPWQDATVADIRVETPRVKTFSLALAPPDAHLAGQHFVVRLTAPDGYTAQRSYSVASPPGDGTSIELTVERLHDGEVSTFLHDELARRRRSRSAGRSVDGSSGTATLRRCSSAAARVSCP